MQHEGPNVKHNKKPIRSGINRYLVARNYRLGEAFLIKDCNSYYDASKIETSNDGHKHH